MPRACQPVEYAGDCSASSIMGNKITRRRPPIDERHTRPQGLYPHRDVDHRKLRRLILDSKLAPCFPGGDEPAADLEECPICCLHYPSLNRSKCCSKGICTECFLQMKSPHAARPTQCPFCKTPNYSVEYRGAKTLEEKGVEQAEEQKVIEAKIRMRQQELQDDEVREQHRQEDIREGRMIKSAPMDGGHVSHQVKPLSDHEKWNQNLQEPSYCPNWQWVRKPTGPTSSESGPSSFKACGPHCAPDCAKCLMAFHKRRGYDILDVITPPSGVWKEDWIMPSAGRWRSTWGNLDSPLSRSFPLPSRVPEYHCRRVRILEPEALGHPPLPDGSQCTCKAKKEEKPAEAPVTSVLSERPSSGVDPDSLWVCGGHGSEGSLDAAALPQQSLVPVVSNPINRQHSGMGFLTPQPAPGAPRRYTRHRDDGFDFDLEDMMVMEAIWLSIQEKGARLDADPVAIAPPPPPVPGLTGGLVGAIAAMAERQAAGGDAAPASQQTVLSIFPPDTAENRTDKSSGK